MGEGTGGKQPYVIGLTGNIATGKSLVGQMLAELGAEHIDADLLAHEVMAPGTPANSEIVAAFGREVQQPDGADRPPPPGARSCLPIQTRWPGWNRSSIPAVIARTRQLIAASRATSRSPAIVIEAIKLIESGMVRQLCDALWVVTAPREVQLARLVASRGLSRAGGAAAHRRPACAGAQGRAGRRGDRQWRRSRGHSLPGGAGLG